MRTILSLIVLLFTTVTATAQPPGPKNAFIELPADMQISSKQRSVKITAKTEGAEVQWVVLNTAIGEGGPIPIQWDDIGNKSIRIYPNDVDDEIFVLAYTTSGTPPKATPPVAMMILVVGPNSAAKKGAALKETAKEAIGDTVPKSGRVAAHVSFIVDPQKQTSEITGIINDASLRTWIAATGARLHAPIDVRSEVVTRAKGGLIAAVRTAGGVPCVVVQDAQGNVIDQGLMSSVQAVRTIISPHVK